MSPDTDKINAIYIRLGELAEAVSAGHARIEGETKVISERIQSLDEKVKIQNGRVTKLENQVGDLKIRATVRDHDADEESERSKVTQARVWGLFAGSVLIALGAIVGNIL